MKASPLQLNHIQFGEVVLTPKATKRLSTSINVTTTPAYGRNNDDSKQWQIKMRVAFKGAGDRPAPYEGHIDVTGVFTVAAPEMSEEQQLRLVAVTCPSILYASAREVIAGFTARSENGLFLLPSVSFADQVLKPQESQNKQTAVSQE